MNTLITDHQFTIEFHTLGLLVKSPEYKGGVPIDALQAAAKLVPESAVMDAGVAGALEAVFAIGTKENMAAWGNQITTQLAASGMSKEQQWIRGIDCGLSSMALFNHLCSDHMHGAVYTRSHSREDTLKSTPQDADDFGRCLRMIEFCGWQDHIKKARDISPEWASIIDRWDSLSELYKRGELNAIQFP